MKTPKSIYSRVANLGDWSESTPEPPHYELASVFEQDSSFVPTPTPGAFEPVINAHSALLSETTEFSLAPDILVEIFDVVEDYFKTNDDIQDNLSCEGRTIEATLQNLFSVCCLSLAIHLAKDASEPELVACGLSDLAMPRLPTTLAEYIGSMGAFVGDDGRFWDLHDRVSTVLSLVRAADDIWHGIPWDCAIDKLWMPVSNDDGHTAHITASRVSTFLKELGYHFRVTELLHSVYSGVVPPGILAILPAMPDGHRQALVRVFRLYSTYDQFLNLYSDEDGITALKLMGLETVRPGRGYLKPGSHVKIKALKVLTSWDMCYGMWTRVFGASFRTVHGDYRVGGTCGPIRVKKKPGGHILVKTYYNLSPAQLTVCALLGSWMEFDIPMRFSYSGYVPTEGVVRALIRHDV